MGRAKTFDDREALETAMLLFWRNGYEATSMQALEDATGLTRPSLYNAFGNKRALFNKALQLYLDTILSKVLAAVDAAPTAKAAVQAALDEAIALHFTPSHPGGCLVVLSLLESHQHDARTRTFLNQALGRLGEGLAARFRRAVKDKDLPGPTDCGALADTVVALISGMIVMAKADVSRARLETVAALAESIVSAGGGIHGE